MKSREAALKHLDDAKRAILKDDNRTADHHMKLAQYCIDGDSEFYIMYTRIWKTPVYWQPETVAI